VIKNAAAKAAVVRLKKLAEPAAPNTLPAEPLPKEAPMSAPLPCWIKIKPTIATADKICTANTIVINTFIANPSNLRQNYKRKILFLRSVGCRIINI
jgi:hypothetical protein